MKAAEDGVCKWGPCDGGIENDIGWCKTGLGSCVVGCVSTWCPRSADYQPVLPVGQADGEAGVETTTTTTPPAVTPSATTSIPVPSTPAAQDVDESTLAETEESTTVEKDEPTSATKNDESTTTEMDESTPAKMHELTPAEKDPSTPADNSESTTGEKEESTLAKKDEKSTPAGIDESAPVESHESQSATPSSSTSQNSSTIPSWTPEAAAPASIVDAADEVPAGTTTDTETSTLVAESTPSVTTAVATTTPTKSGQVMEHDPSGEEGQVLEGEPAPLAPTATESTAGTGATASAAPGATAERLPAVAVAERAGDAAPAAIDTTVAESTHDTRDENEHASQQAAAESTTTPSPAKGAAPASEGGYCNWFDCDGEAQGPQWCGETVNNW